MNRIDKITNFGTGTHFFNLDSGTGTGTHFIKIKINNKNEKTQVKGDNFSRTTK
jgi:hypothetical protein